MWLLWGVVCLVQQALASEKFISGRHLNPQEFMTIPEIIQYWGYPSEEDTILTEDGYYLQANRILPHGIHSSGKTGIFGFIAFSTMPQLAKKVKLFMGFAPAYTLAGFQGFFSFLLHLPEALIRLIWGNKEYCVLSNKLKAINAKICSHPVIDKICLQLLSFLQGSNEENLNVSQVDVYVGILPDFSSVKTIIHWSQVAKTNPFKYFDYGPENKAVYNMSTPPFYKIEDVTVPTAVRNGGHDIAVTTEDTERLLPRITHLVFYKNIPDWQHTDFIWGLDAPEQLYKDVLCLKQKFK